MIYVFHVCIILFGSFYIEILYRAGFNGLQSLRLSRYTRFRGYTIFGWFCFILLECLYLIMTTLFLVQVRKWYVFVYYLDFIGCLYYIPILFMSVPDTIEWRIGNVYFCKYDSILYPLFRDVKSYL